MLETMGMAITSNNESFIEKAFEFIWEQMQAVKVEDMGVPELGWLDNEDGMLKRVPVDQVFYTHLPVETLQAKKSMGSDPLYSLVCFPTWRGTDVRGRGARCKASRSAFTPAT